MVRRQAALLKLHQGLRTGGARLHQHRFHAGSMPEFDIPTLVPDHIGSREVEPEVSLGPLDHQRSRLPAEAAVVRMMRTEINGVQLRAGGRQQLSQAAVRGLQDLGCEHPAPDAGLIRNQDDAGPRAIESSHAVCRAGDHLQFLRVSNIADLVIQGAVPIQKHRDPLE